MPTTITYLGHSGVLIRRGAVTLAIDPFLTGNPAATVKAADLKPTHILVTHGHADHVGDTVAIARATGATVYANWELCEYFGEQGLKHLEPGNPGGRIRTGFGFVAFTRAHHSSSLDGRYMGNPCGVVAHLSPGAGEPAFTAYHCGDTDLFSDMRLIGEVYRPDVAFIPIGDRFTMGPLLASRAAELIGARAAVPIHYNTWPPIEVDVREFRPSGVEVKALRPGQEWAWTAPGIKA